MAAARVPARSMVLGAPPLPPVFSILSINSKIFSRELLFSEGATFYSRSFRHAFRCCFVLDFAMEFPMRTPKEERSSPKILGLINRDGPTTLRPLNRAHLSRAEAKCRRASKKILNPDTGTRLLRCEVSFARKCKVRHTIIFISA